MSGRAYSLCLLVCILAGIALTGWLADRHAASAQALADASMKVIGAKAL